MLKELMDFGKVGKVGKGLNIDEIYSPPEILVVLGIDALESIKDVKDNEKCIDKDKIKFFSINKLNEWDKYDMYKEIIDIYGYYLKPLGLDLNKMPASVYCRVFKYSFAPFILNRLFKEEITSVPNRDERERGKTKKEGLEKRIKKVIEFYSEMSLDDNNSFTISDDSKKLLLTYYLNVAKVSKEINDEIKDKINPNKDVKKIVILFDIFNKDKIEIFIKIFENFVNKKMMDKKPIEGKCLICQETTLLSNFPIMNTFDSTKLFMKHLTTNYQINLFCSKCIKLCLKSLAFFYQKKINIVPLFINKNEITKEINLIEKNKKITFREIMDDLEVNNKRFDFYLYLHNWDKIIYFDYIYNYKWSIGSWKYFFNNRDISKDNTSKDITRIELEIILKNLLGIKKIDYFSKIDKEAKEDKKTDKSAKFLSDMIYTYRKKVFDYVYRGKNTLIEKDILEIFEKVMNHLIKENDDKNMKKFINPLLNLWFNRKIFLEGDNMVNMVSVNELREIVEKIKLNQDGVKVEKDNNLVEAWMYLVGGVYHYLVSKTKSQQDKDMPSLLDKIIFCNEISEIPNLIYNMIEKYAFALNQKENQIICYSLTYPAVQDKIKLKNLKIRDYKPYFYAGYFDAGYFESKYFNFE